MSVPSLIFCLKNDTRDDGWLGRASNPGSLNKVYHSNCPKTVCFTLKLNVLRWAILDLDHSSRGRFLKRSKMNCLDNDVHFS